MRIDRFPYPIIRMMPLLLRRKLKHIICFCFTPVVFLLNKFKHRPVIILMDRRNTAGDNAEAMYHYLVNQKDYDVYYILDPKSKDWSRLQPDRHVIDIGSWCYFWVFFMADVAMYSGSLYYPVWGFVFRELMHMKQVFLQHGVIHEDLSALYHAGSGHDLVCVATMPEYEDRLRLPYGYDASQIVLTGLPRFDYLENQNEKIITIGLTWRKWLKDVPLTEFIASDYYSMIKQLIIAPELADLAETYGYKIQFVPHPMLTDNVIQMLSQKRDHRILFHEAPLYRKIISESALLITDYSSLAFDMAYLKKPVVYYQLDKDEFCSGKHTYVPSYFDFERDGFGEIVMNTQELLTILKDYLQNHCEMNEMYRLRCEHLFIHNDHCNRQRVWDAVQDRVLNK